MTPLEVFTRCHLQLTAEVPSQNSQIYRDVRDKKITADEGCARIFDLGKFQSNGVLVGQNDPLSRKVLERIHHIHRNWFAQQVPVGYLRSTEHIHDFEESALYLTRSAFQPGAKFSDAVTLNSGLRGLRVRSTEGTLPPYIDHTVLAVPAAFPSGFPRNILRITYTGFTAENPSKITTSIKTLDLAPALLAQRGHLIGVSAPPSITLPNLYVGELFIGSYESKSTILQDLRSVRLNSHFGGGMLGSQAFILTNTNLNRSQRPNGENLIHRRLTTRIHEDLMCHSFPNLNAGDVTAEVIANSPHGFRRSSTCMQCHSTMDPLAQTYRNMIFTFARGDVDLAYRVDFVKAIPVTNDPDQFHTQTPSGRLKYRTLLKKQLVTQNVSSISQIGSHVANSDDLYLCSAKKYYKYFTGVDVQLNSYEKTGTAEALHQNQVIALSQKLKTSQSVRETLKSLFATPVYQSRDFLSQEVPK